MFNRGQSNVSGTVLLVGVAVVLSAAVGGYLLAFSGNLNDNARGEVDVSENPDGTFTVTLEDAKNSERVIVRDSDGDTWNLTESGDQITIQPGDEYVIIGETEDGTQTVIDEFDYSEMTAVPTIIPVTTTATPTSPTPTATATATDSPTGTATVSPTPTPTPSPTPTTTPTPSPTPTTTPTATPDGTSPGDTIWSLETGMETAPHGYNGLVLVTGDTDISSDYEAIAVDQSTGNIVWQVSLGDTSITRMQVENGVAYVGTENAGLYAFDADDGSEIWHKPSANAYSSLTVTDDGSRLYYIGEDTRTVYAVDATDGSQIWSNSGDNYFKSAIQVADDGTVIVTGENVVSFASDGTENWRYDHGSSFYQQPVVTSDRIYSIADNDDVVAIKRGSIGVLEDRYAWINSGVYGDYLNYYNGNLYYGETSTTLVAVDETDGSEVWSRSLSIGGRYTKVAAPTFADGNIYVGAMYESDGLYSLDASSGATNWHSTSHDVGGGITVVDGSLYLTNSTSSSSTPTYMYKVNTDHSASSSGNFCGGLKGNDGYGC